MIRYRVLPYKQGSKAAKSLAGGLGGKVLRLYGSVFQPQPDDVIINWGNTKVNQTEHPAIVNRLLNPPSAIKSASNKRTFFMLMAENGHANLLPRFWVNQAEIPVDAYPVVCRQSLAGHSGEGIVIADTVADLVPAPLYVQYVKKVEEYRIHIGMDYLALTGDAPKVPIVIAIQQKKRRLEVPDDQVDWKVRNHKNGFVYTREGVNPPKKVIDAAKAVLEASGLDFGAVDVIWNAEKKRAFVLEINTAPGLEGQTITDYANFFKGLA